MRERFKPTPGMAPLVIKWLRELRTVVYGRPVDQLKHSLETATLAAADGASEEMIGVALCHDMAKVVSWEEHGKLSADILKPYCSSSAFWIVATHHDFLAIYNTNRSGMNPYALRTKYEGRRWYNAAIRFADDWDSLAYSPSMRSLSLRQLEPLLTRWLAVPKRKPTIDTGYALLARLDANRRLRPPVPKQRILAS